MELFIEWVRITWLLFWNQLGIKMFYFEWEEMIMEKVKRGMTTERRRHDVFTCFSAVFVYIWLLLSVILLFMLYWKHMVLLISTLVPASIAVLLCVCTYSVWCRSVCMRVCVCVCVCLCLWLVPRPIYICQVQDHLESLRPRITAAVFSSVSL